MSKHIHQIFSLCLHFCVCDCVCVVCECVCMCLLGGISKGGYVPFLWSRIRVWTLTPFPCWIMAIVLLGCMVAFVTSQATLLRPWPITIAAFDSCACTQPTVCTSPTVHFSLINTPICSDMCCDISYKFKGHIPSGVRELSPPTGLSHYS